MTNVTLVLYRSRGTRAQLQEQEEERRVKRGVRLRLEYDVCIVCECQAANTIVTDNMAAKCYVTPWEVGGVQFRLFQRYEGVQHY